MARRLLQIGGVQPGHRFQADRYSFGERKRRRERSIFHRQAVWWEAASPMERACRVLWWSCLAAVGITAGFIAVMVVGSIL